MLQAVLSSLKQNVHAHANVYAIVGGVFFGLFLGVLLLVCIPADGWFSARHALRNFLTGEPVIRLKKQALSSEYVVPYVHLKEPGHIGLVYADALDTPGVEGDELGQSRYLIAGTHRNVVVSVSKVIPGRAFFLCLMNINEEGRSFGTLLDSTSSVVCERGRAE